MTVFIDSRIGSREISHHLSRYTPRMLTTLEYGDASWLGNGPEGEGTACVGVERKRLRDMLSSMESGRLANHQLIGMANAYHYSYVVVEGIWRSGVGEIIEIPRGRGKWEPLTLGSRKFTVSVMDNFTNTLQCMLGVMVVFTPTLERTCMWITNVYRWWTAKKWHQHRSVNGKVSCRGIPVLARGKAPLVARVAMELAGVGSDKALKLAERYPSVTALCAATREELMEIPGIGKVMAEGIAGELTGH
jgi:ERCC4-type nuclease